MVVGGVALGGGEVPRVVVRGTAWTALDAKRAELGEMQPEIILEQCGVLAIDPADDAAVAKVNAFPEPLFLTISDGCALDPLYAYRLLAARVEPRHPILLKDTFRPVPHAGEGVIAGEESPALPDPLPPMLAAASRIGALLCDGIGDAVLVQGEPGPGASVRLAYNILQASGTRIFKTDYVACPSCGRTLFNLQSTTQKIRAATGHLKGVRIAVMGCIVNGPGEMADADFGYVGGAPGKINLYVGKTPVKFNIPEGEAVERLIDLIREHGKWQDAA